MCTFSPTMYIMLFEKLSLYNIRIIYICKGPIYKYISYIYKRYLVFPQSLHPIYTSHEKILKIGDIFCQFIPSKLDIFHFVNVLLTYLSLIFHHPHIPFFFLDLIRLMDLIAIIKLTTQETPLCYSHIQYGSE